MSQQGSLSLPLSPGNWREYVHPSRGTWAPRPVSAALIGPLMAVMDVAVMIGTAVIAYVVWLLDDPYSTWNEYALVVVFATLLGVNVFNLARIYGLSLLRKPRQMLGRTAACWCTVAAMLMVVSFLTKTSDDYSRIWALMWFGLAMVGLMVTRWLLLARTRRWVAEGRLQKTVAIVGTGPLAEQLERHFSANPNSGIRVIGLFTDGQAPARPWKMRATYGGDLDQLIRLVRLEAVEMVIVAEEDESAAHFNETFARLRETPADVRYCPGLMALELSQHEVSHCADVPMINVVDRPLSEWRYIMKAIEDRVLATLILLLISPILIGIGILIRLDSPGPALFRQKRYGYNNQLVEVWKFRTMRHDLQDPKAEQLTQHNDPRITRIGAFLRRWSLDELPQFINVLRGEMSIVGPRPHAISAKAGGRLYQQAVPQYAARHRVKPGITGWAQVNGWRGPTDTVRQIEKRVEHDMYYIEHWSIWLDLKIIFMTVFRGFSGQNAF